MVDKLCRLTELDIAGRYLVYLEKLTRESNLDLKDHDRSERLLKEVRDYVDFKSTVSSESNASRDKILRDKVIAYMYEWRDEVCKEMKKDDLDPTLLINVDREDILGDLTSLYTNYVNNAKEKMEDFFGNITTKIGHGLYYPILLAKRAFGGKEDYSYNLISKHVLTPELMKKLDTVASSPLWTLNAERDVNLLKKLPTQYGSFDCSATIDELEKVRKEFESYEAVVSMHNFFGVHIKPCKDPKGFVWDIELNRDIGKTANVLVEFVTSVDVEMAVGVELRFLHNGNNIEKFNSQTFNKLLKEKIKVGVEDDKHANNNKDYLYMLVKTLGAIYAHKVRVYKFLKDLKIQSVRKDNRKEVEDVETMTNKVPPKEQNVGVNNIQPKISDNTILNDGGQV